MKKLLSSVLTLSLALSLGVTTFASTFTPSAEAGTVTIPALSTTEDGKPSVGTVVVKDKDGNETSINIEPGDLLSTGANGIDADTNLSAEEKAFFKEAVSSAIENEGKYTNLDSSFDDILAEYNSYKTDADAVAGDFVIAYSIEVYPVDTLAEHFDAAHKNGESLAINLNLIAPEGVKEGERIIAMHKRSTDNTWETLLTSPATKSGDKLVMSLTLNTLSPVVFLVEKDSAAAGDKDDTDSEASKTGDNSNVMMYVIIMAVAVVGLAGALVIKKKARNN